MEIDGYVGRVALSIMKNGPELDKHYIKFWFNASKQCYLKAELWKGATNFCESQSWGGTRALIFNST